MCDITLAKLKNQVNEKHSVIPFYSICCSSRWHATTLKELVNW